MLQHRAHETLIWPTVLERLSLSGDKGPFGVPKFSHQHILCFCPPAWMYNKKIDNENRNTSNDRLHTLQRHSPQEQPVSSVSFSLIQRLSGDLPHLLLCHFQPSTPLFLPHSRHSVQLTDTQAPPVLVCNPSALLLPLIRQL